MRNAKIGWLSLLPLWLAVLPQAQGAETVAPEKWLLEQVRLGEASNRDELVRQSLYRLELMAPDDPDVISARMRLALRQGNQELAQQQLDKLKKVAPQSEIYHQAEVSLMLTQPEMRQKLQQARLLTAAGRLPEAKAQYDALFHGVLPSRELALEYWQLEARFPGQEALAIAKIQGLDQQYPGNEPLRLALAQLLFSQGRDAQAYDVLQKMAVSPTGYDAAAKLWLEKVTTLPTSKQSVEALNRFLSVFETGGQATQARQELARQQTLLADPVYQARLVGLERVAQGGSSSAISVLKKALAAKPGDVEMLGALGLAYSRAGQRQQALSVFLQAQKADQNGFDSSKWQSLIKSTRYWLTIDEGDNALKANNLLLAQQKYQQARQIDNSDSAALIGLGNLSEAYKNDTVAEQQYQQALRLDVGNSSAIRGLVNIYQRQSLEKALEYLQNLPQEQQSQLRSTIDNLQQEMLTRQADQFVEQKQWYLAVEKYRQAHQMAPDDVWLTYHYAQTLRQTGKIQQADALFSQLAQRQRNDPKQIYAYALYLSGSNQDSQALAHLNTLPPAQWSDNMRELAQRLNKRAVLEHAEVLRAAGDEPKAIAYLRRQPADTRIDLMLADWAQERAAYGEALAGYQRVQVREPDNIEARLGEIEAYVAEKKQVEAGQRLHVIPPQRDISPGNQRRIANAWCAVGEQQQAVEIFSQLRAAVREQPPGQVKALIYRDVARLEQTQQQYVLAQQDYRMAMVASGITNVVPQDNIAYTLLMRNDPSDDWLKRGIRSEAADLYQQQDINVTLNHDSWRSSGTGGLSDYTARDTELQLDMPWHDGRAFFRTDVLQLNAGTFSPLDGKYFETFGTCRSVGCSGDEQQSTRGASVAVGWENDRWKSDIGTTPLGFEVVDWVGGVAYSGDWNHIGWTLGASRRPLSSSLLAFGGTRDPNTGIVWGGVRATGVNLSASYDRGKANGAWANFSAHQLTGQNVANNQRQRLMAGYYYKAINEDNRRVSVGLNGMLWRYQKDLSGYSLGQGGYYSPQGYASLAIPVSYRQRTENWSWELEGAVSVSRANTSDRRRYPLQNIIPDTLPDKFAIENGSSSSGIGYTLRAAAERRLSSHWTLGAGVDIQQAKDYTPSHALVYLRYSLSGWQGDLDLPLRPLTPYADFK